MKNILYRTNIHVNFPSTRCWLYLISFSLFALQDGSPQTGRTRLSSASRGCSDTCQDLGSKKTCHSTHNAISKTNFLPIDGESLDQLCKIKQQDIFQINHPQLWLTWQQANWFKVGEKLTVRTVQDGLFCLNEKRQCVSVDVSSKGKRNCVWKRRDFYLGGDDGVVVLQDEPLNVMGPETLLLYWPGLQHSTRVQEAHVRKDTVAQSWLMLSYYRKKEVPRMKSPLYKNRAHNTSPNINTI